MKEETLKKYIGKEVKLFSMSSHIFDGEIQKVEGNEITLIRSNGTYTIIEIAPIYAIWDNQRQLKF